MTSMISLLVVVIIKTNKWNRPFLEAIENLTLAFCKRQKWKKASES